MTVMGIKCDNPTCDIIDMSVKVENYVNVQLKLVEILN